MTDQTPQTEAHAHPCVECDTTIDYWVKRALRAEADRSVAQARAEDVDAYGDGLRTGLKRGEAQARAEGLDVEVLKAAIHYIVTGPCDKTATRRHGVTCGHPTFITDIGMPEALAREYRAILAARRDEG